MKNYDTITPEGTKDLLFNECVARRNVENSINEIFKSRGYMEIVTPGLEFFDVFNLNSRHFPQESMYKLVDNKGRLLVLRPDNTMPIARVVATRLKDAILPLRLYYNQCVYNINPQLRGRSDESVQAGIELIGSSSDMADLEVIGMAIDVLDVCSDGEYSLEIGNSGIFKELVSNLDVSEDMKESIRSLIESKNYPVLNDTLDTLGDSKVIKSLRKLPRLFGNVDVLEKASNIFNNKNIDMYLNDLRSTYENVKSLYPNAKINIDLGMVNRADYYTGIIIKGYVEGCGDEVLSGGRYDRLIAEFGYDIPATGFAINVDAVAQMVSKKKKVSNRHADVIVFAEEGYEMKAMQVAQKMRKEGLKVENSFIDDLESVREYALETKIPKIMIINENVTEVE
jgi:ATP phosphoribosyltransferase regulatory subunit